MRADPARLHTMPCAACSHTPLPLNSQAREDAVNVGAHVSASGGLHKAVARAMDDGCEALQVFVKNNNRWTQRAWRDDEIQSFKDAYARSPLRGLMAHTAYLINLCSSNEATVSKSIDALADELNRCAQLGVPMLVMHPGSHVGQGEEEGLKLIAKNLERVYALEKQEAWKDVTLLFENTAGQGTNLGHDIEHLAELFARVHEPERFGVCFDTCHAHAAGYDLTTREQYESFWQSFDEVVGVERVRGFHLNDSRKPLGSRRDRHENIGEGELGRAPFEFLLNDARFAQHPGTLETAPHETDGYTHELSLLKSMREPQEQ